jgi:hypothetical protein
MERPLARAGERGPGARNHFVIPYAEIQALRDEWGIRDGVVEKDYVLG